MTDPRYIEQAAETVRQAVEADEAKRFIKMTEPELNSLPCYQHTMPTSPRVGFRYRRRYVNGWHMIEVVPARDADGELVPGYVDHVPRLIKVIP